MRLIVIAAAVSMLTTSAAYAYDDTVMAADFGNTLISKTNGGGPEAHIYFSADHSFTGKVISPAIELKGTWSVDGDNFCMVYKPVPFGVRSPQCTPLSGPHQVGDTWTDGKRTLTLVAGIQ